MSRNPKKRQKVAAQKGGSERASHVLLGFLVLLLLALGLVPLQLSKGAAPLETVVPVIYEPAQRRAWAFHVSQVRAFSRLQAFLQTQSAVERRRIREVYDAERAVADTAFQELSQLITVRLPEQTGQRDEVLELRLTELWDRAEDWHLHHLPVLAGDIPLNQWLPRVQTEQRYYDGLLTASQNLNTAFQDRVDELRLDAAESARLQQQITSYLVVAGLIAAFMAILAVVLVARRLRRLAKEADQRRGDAVVARRETDAVLRATADGVIGVDLEGHCTFINRSAAEMLGRSPRNALGRDLDSVVFGDGAATETRLFKPAFEDGNVSFSTDAEFVRQDGSRFPAKVSCRPMIDGREVRGAVLSFVDLTQVREVEAALRSAVRARDEVVGVVSHDLRNPVGTIYIAADLLLEVPLPPEKQNEQLRVIKRQAKVMEELIRDLLDITRIETGTLPVHAVPQPIEGLLDDVLAQARPLAARKGVALIKDLNGRPLEVNADRNRVLQVFSNLLGNAIKFTPEGGRITIRTEPKNGEVEFTVADTGIGIPPDQLDRIFDRFWQMSEGQGGAGLGLSIAKGIVEAHEGRIWAESGPPGEGTRFMFTLPASEGAAPESSKPLFGTMPNTGGLQ